MKYWVFNDARILGPYSREELAGIEAVHAGTLVCQEGVTGVADGDWRALEAVPELAGLAMASAPAGGFAASPFSETLDPSDPAAAAWPPVFEDDPRFGFWMREEMETERSVEFARTLSEMREQMARHERRQDEILDRLNAKDAELVKRESEIAELKAQLKLYQTGAARPAVQPPVARAPLPAAKPPAAAAPAAQAPAPAKAAPPPPPAAKEPEVPAARAPEPAPAPKLEMESALEAAAPSLDVPLPPGETESPARAAMRAARAAKKGLPPSAPMEIALPEMPVFEPPAAEPMPSEAAPALEAPAFGLPGDGIPESESLSPVAEIPPPLDFAPPIPEDSGLAAPPLDAPPPFAEPPLADPSAPPPLSPFADPAYQTQAQPQQPGQFQQPATVIFGGGGGLNLTPSPSSLGPTPFGSTPEPIPLGDPGAMATPMPTMGQPDLPQNVMAGLGVGGQATPFPFGQQTPLPRLPGQQTSAFDQPITAAPRPLESSPGMPPAVPPTGAAPASKAAKFKEMLKSKKFIIVLAVSVLALAGILAMFLRNPKQLSKTVDMAPDHKAQGSFEDNGPAPRGPAPSPFQKAPSGEAPAPARTAPDEPAPAPAPKAAPAKGKDYVSDGSVRAIEFVKNYKLDEARGTVGGYLQYAFLGPDTMPGWQAGAIEKDVWFVQYNVFKGAPGGRGAKPTYSFRFEVDLAKRTMKGVNPSAQEMLNPGGAPEKPKRKTRRRASAGDSQEPLPGDDDLDGAPGGGSGFNNPGG